jgi:hypothetical protein
LGQRLNRSAVHRQYKRGTMHSISQYPEVCSVSARYISSGSAWTVLQYKRQYTYCNGVPVLSVRQQLLQHTGSPRHTETTVAVRHYMVNW